MRAVYIIWLILPIFYSFIVAKAWLKKVSKSGTREDTKNYFQQFIFVTIGFITAVVIDEPLRDFIDSLALIDEQSLQVVSWLTYPLVLVLMATIQNFFSKEDTKPKIARF